MVLLTAIVTPIAMLASWRIEEKVPLYFSMVLFPANRIVWDLYRVELSLVHLLGTWPDTGLFPDQTLGRPGRSAAATQFFIYTMNTGSIAMPALIPRHLLDGAEPLISRDSQNWVVRVNWLTP